jgi:hypothetical protein
MPVGPLRPVGVVELLEGEGGGGGWKAGRPSGPGALGALSTVDSPQARKLLQPRRIHTQAESRGVPVHAPQPLQKAVDLHGADRQAQARPGGSAHGRSLAPPATFPDPQAPHPPPPPVPTPTAPERSPPIWQPLRADGCRGERRGWRPRHQGMCDSLGNPLGAAAMGHLRSPCQWIQPEGASAGLGLEQTCSAWGEAIPDLVPRTSGVAQAICSAGMKRTAIASKAPTLWARRRSLTMAMEVNHQRVPGEGWQGQ